MCFILFLFFCLKKGRAMWKLLKSLYRLYHDETQAPSPARRKHFMPSNPLRFSHSKPPQFNHPLPPQRSGAPSRYWHWQWEVESSEGAHENMRKSGRKNKYVLVKDTFKIGSNNIHAIYNDIYVKKIYPMV